MGRPTARRRGGVEGGAKGSLHVFIDNLIGSRQQLKRVGVVDAFLGSWCGVMLREILPEQSLKVFRLRSAYLVFLGHYIWIFGSTRVSFP